MNLKQGYTANSTRSYERRDPEMMYGALPVHGWVKLNQDLKKKPGKRIIRRN